MSRYSKLTQRVLGKNKLLTTALLSVSLLTLLAVCLLPSQSSASSPISIDANVSTHQSSKSSSISSPAFSTTQPNELLVAYLGSDGPNKANGQTFSSVTGGGLTWTLRQRTNSQAGDAEVWQAVAPTTLSSVTIKATRSSGSYDGMMDVVSYIGANTSVNGATATQSAASGAPTVSLTTTANNSWVWAVGNDWDNNTARTLGSGQTMLDQYLDTGTGDTYWAQYESGQAQTTGTKVTLNDTAPTADRWNMAAIEILPAQTDTTPPTVPTNLTATAASGTQVNLGWTASTDNVGVTGYNIYRNGSKIATSPTNNYVDTTVSPNTTYSYTVSAYDAAGNTSAQTSAVYVTTPQVYTAPIVSISSSPASTSNSSSATFAFSASNSSDPSGTLVYDCSLDGASPVSCVSPEAYSGLSNGSHSFSVTATDTTDGLTSNPQNFNWLIDTVPPAVSITSPTSGSTVSGSTTLSANASDNTAVASVQYQLDGSNLGSAITSSPYNYSWNTTAASNGTHALTAIATDTAGNSTTSSTVTVTVNNVASLPVNTGEPVVTGTVATGSVLSTTNGTWSNSPTSYTYQWQQCATDGTSCSPISGATSQTYTVATGDSGHTLTAVVTAHNGAGSAADTAPTVPAIDEFNGSSIDTNVWTVLNQQGDTSNAELECYEPSQATETGGSLNETMQYVSSGITCPTGTPNSTNPLHYLSGAVQMKSVSFTYGTVVARMKMSGGTGTWPALWLSGASCQLPTFLTAPGFNCAWPSDSSDAAEVDIAEDGGGSGNTVRENLYNTSVSHACNYNVGSDISAGYHTYELDWSPGSLVFKVDGVTTSCGTTTGVPSHPMFLIMNTAACTMNACGVLPNNSTLPQTTSVDYIHVSH